MEAKGAKKLKVVGILFIIFGAISVVFYTLGLAGGGLMAGLSDTIAEGDAATASTVATGGSLLMLISIIYLIWGIVELIAGILGVKNCKKPEKAKTLFNLAILLIVFTVAANGLNISSNGFSASTLLSMAWGLLLPVIFIIGAKQNMNS